MRRKARLRRESLVTLVKTEATRRRVLGCARLAETMQLVINTFGASLRRKGDRAPSQSVSLELDTLWDQIASAAGMGVQSRSQNR